MKVKSFKCFKHKLKKIFQVFFNIAMIIVIAFLIVQTIHIKKELQVSKANEFKLFSEINKQNEAIFDLQKNIISLDKIISEQHQDIKKIQNKK